MDSNLWRTASGALAPPRCAACRGPAGPEEAICARCHRRLGGIEPVRGRLGLRGLDSAWASAVHEGVARELVVALKYRRLLAVAEPMAERIARLAPPFALGGHLVPVPTSPVRSFVRGFDPAVELARALAERIGAESLPRLLRRRGLGGRQVGRRRADRLGRPPSIEARGPAPRGVVLVDDVLTTGATLSAAALALRDAGAVRVVAVTFTRSP